jgi:D-methionine transport system substrate-binding protein
MYKSFCFFLVALCALCGLSGCFSKQKKDNVITVQASALPQAELLAQVKQSLAAEGWDLQIIVVDDYNLPNRALHEGEIDANFFQHRPFLLEQIRTSHYHDLAVLTDVHIEPMGLYTKKQTKILPVGGIVSLPNDPTNETRALLLLQKGGWIRLKEKETFLATLDDIVENPLHLRFKELDAALLSRTLEEVDGAVIPTNYALVAGLNPREEALLLEDSSSLYANIVAVRSQDLTSPKLLALKKALDSETLRHYVNTTYNGALVLPNSQQ